MTSITDKRHAAASHVLDLLLSCQRHEAELVLGLSHAFTSLYPCPHYGEFDLDDDDDGPVPACVNTPIPTPDVPVTPQPPVEVVPDPAPAPARKAPAKKAAAKPPAAAPAPTPTPVATEDAAEATMPPEEVERFRALIRDTFVAKTKLITKEADPDNVRRIDFTAKFTAVVESFGAKTVSLTAASDLPALLDAVRAIQV